MIQSLPLGTSPWAHAAAYRPNTAGAVILV
jgi:hypothetical protein